MRWTWMAVWALVAGCDGIELEQLVKQHASRTRMVPEPRGPNCAQGGHALQSGLDLDDDGVLDNSEVTTTEYACAVALTRRQPEPAGAHCSLGGQVFQTGIDVDGSGVLEDAEVTASEYLCVTPFPDVLVLTREVPSGAQCLHGGQVSRAGHDTNGNGTLEDGEVTREVYGCMQPEQVLTRIRSGAPVPYVCAIPITIVEAGPDLDRDGELDDAETRGRANFCATSAAVVVRQTPEPAGSRCLMGGTRVMAGWDSNGDGELGGNETGAPIYVCNALHSYEASYPVRSEADLAALEGISRIRGNFSVISNTLTELVLPRLTTVEGQLHISNNPALKRLELPNLRFVQQDLVVKGNPLLKDLVLGANETVWVESSLELSSNPVLKSLGGVSLVSPRKSVILQDNDALEYESILGAAAFQRVETLSGSLVVSGNDELAELPFPVLTHVNGPVQVANNGVLRNLSLPDLRSIGGSLHVTHNDALWSLEGLERLQEVGGLTLEENASLAQLGLSALQRVNQALTVTHNPKLPTCLATRLASAVYTGTPDLLRISDNDDTASCDD
ncbi:hypothetical protein HPC49_06395 [Pyxidicoccus fallax]|uniref:DUF7151 domain-containing protein n=1 Tax=Pyxidicoccus fallax TaxID=394095 RepID=A0A848LCK1_9BACT|nr:hypothetical protein [Pyxidicoccus fallax]NMO14463.1 hypothetical protein [Pyxidicoccus fallax]NPC77883.1 hypothetical protein [Pyxidicoccus fallax]